MASSQYPKTIETIQTLSSEDTRWGVLVSVGLHIALVLMFFIKAWLIPNEKIDYEAAIRVDLVGLPDKLNAEDLRPTPPSKVETKKEEAKTPPPVEKSTMELPKKEKLDPEAVNLEKIKKRQQEALSKIRSNEAIEKLKKEMEAQKKAEAAAAAASAARANKVKGNVLSAGTELTGLNKLQHDDYVRNLDHHIKNNWSLPEWLAKKEFKAQVLLKIDEKGFIVSRQITKSSGNPNYDEVVLETIDRSAPFPAPPEKLVAVVGVRGILIGFPE